MRAGIKALSVQDAFLEGAAINWRLLQGRKKTESNNSGELYV